MNSQTNSISLAGPAGIRSESVVRPSPMKNPYDVLRAKEQELIKVRKEMDALRIAARLLGAEDKSAGEVCQPLTRVVEMP